MNTVSAPPAAPCMIVDKETIDHLPAFHRAVVEVLIEKGRWQLADGQVKA